VIVWEESNYNLIFLMGQHDYFKLPLILSNQPRYHATYSRLSVAFVPGTKIKRLTNLE